MTEHFFGGGTNYEKPLQMALDIMEERFDALGKARPDIVFITDDAYGSMDPDFMHEWNRVKDKTSLKCYGIAIGCDSSGALAAVSDNRPRDHCAGLRPTQHGRHLQDRVGRFAPKQTDKSS